MVIPGSVYDPAVVKDDHVWRNTTQDADDRLG
jgi:hypothetical protein